MRRTATLSLLSISMLPFPSAAQRTSPPPSAAFLIGGQAIAVITRESPAYLGETMKEGYVSQPALMAHASLLQAALVFQGTLNLEGVTLKRGELTPGIYGEGYIDRRHPHTYLHELVLTAGRYRDDWAFSLTAGKGFAPFGTDDPMARPFEKYPVNHHLAQLLERVIAVAAVRKKGILAEAGLLNGDEPESPGDTPNRANYWNSWAGRLTLVPFPQAEIQASYARVKSPENATGGGADQHKQSASVRLEDAQHSGYAMVEWARTGDYVGGKRVFSFSSLLVETDARLGAMRGGLRFERTERPDEERLLDPFRTPVPAPDLNINGRSRWTTLTARLSGRVTVPGAVRIEPFVEAARAQVSPTLQPSAFDPRQFYGSSRIWVLSAGTKLSFGMPHMRMGRYGAAVGGVRGTSMNHQGMDHSKMERDR